MKKLVSIGVTFLSIFFITSLIINPVSAKALKNTDNGSNPIPEGVMKIAQKSCVKCHAEPAKGMPISMLNLTNWGNLSEEKQAAKAKAMCKMVTKGKMPPKKYLGNNPESAPTKEEITTICDWAQSLQVVKK
jgi:cytochrome c5